MPQDARWGRTYESYGADPALVKQLGQAAVDDGSPVPRELHILGYFLDTQNAKLLTEIAKFQVVRQQRIRDMVARLNELPVITNCALAPANSDKLGAAPVEVRRAI